MIEDFEAKLREKWKITDCERLSSFLGINIYYDRKSGKITFDVANKIDKIFEEKPYLRDIPTSDLPMTIVTDSRKVRDSDEMFAKLLVYADSTSSRLTRLRSS